LTTDQQLKDLCQILQHAEVIAWDTEFVSEDTYRPKLCLIQICTPPSAQHPGQLVAVDPLEIRDLGPLWEVLTNGPAETIVHAGREEIGFCFDAVGKRPARVFDVQLAAGLIGLEYPAGYATLTQRLLGTQPGKGETRTDWRKRPLTKHQLHYALDDVRYLLPLRDAIVAKLDEYQRRAWFEEEINAWLKEIEEARKRERWRNVSGSGSLKGRPLMVLRELWRWREGEALRRNLPPRRVLRDDLLIELAKRQVTDPQQVCAVRGMERPEYRQAIPQLIACVQRGLAAPESDWPRPVRPEVPPQLTMLGQFLAAAIASLCQRSQIAASLVGNPTDARDLIVHQLHGGPVGDDPPPRLMQGWRAELVGEFLSDLLTGKLMIRIQNPRADDPLSFETFGGPPTQLVNPRRTGTGSRRRGRRAPDPPAE